MRQHRQTGVIIRNQVIQMDAGIVELIKMMNKIPGVETVYSCQGDDGLGGGYVLFGGKRALHILPAIAMGIFQEEVMWKRKHQHNCRGCRSMSIRLEVDGIGLVLRWAPRDYRRVLRLVRSVSRSARPARLKTDVVRRFSLKANRRYVEVKSAKRENGQNNH